jgi:transitional endoplasmic reticulum ATPase
MHRYERWIIRRYLANALKTSRLGKPPQSEADIVAWIDSHGRALGLPEMAHRPGPRRRERFSDPPEFKRGWKAWRAKAIAIAREPAPNPSPLQRRVDWLANACSLDAPQRWTLGLFARIAFVPAACALVAAINDRLGLDVGASAISELRPCLEVGGDAGDIAPEGRLAHLGLIDVRDEPRLTGVVRRILSLPRLGAHNVSDLLLGKPESASLGWDDFAHLGDMRDLAARIVQTSGKARGAAQGANILLYGPPGTGKSEFAKTLGAFLGFSVQFCGESGDGEREPNRRERIAALMIANAIGGVARKTVIVVDEADDLFAGVDEDDASTRRGSKVFMNRLVERAAAPTIWITNEIDRLGPSVVRRMNLVLRFARPSLAVRKNMVERIARAAGFRLDANSALGLARAPAAPALIENAIRSAAAIKGSAVDARKILESGLQALGVRERPTAPTPIDFDPALSSADVDLAELADQIARSPCRALSFCLSGLPGTGKSAYARHLAERLDMEILEKRFSDLASMYLGESEKAFAAAFEEAADLRAFLILDEADSLLRDRSMARNSWEVTQVNEMLTWMERHPFPFACTTNAPDLLDPALARRILFKVRFLPMTPWQIATTYRRMFGSNAPASVLKLATLAPGDFAIVARKATVTNERDPKRLAKWLEDEAMAKPGASQRRMGF